MKAKNTGKSYRQVAQHLEGLVSALEAIVKHYNEANCTFAEALGEQGLSHELNEGGRFHYLPALFDQHVKGFDQMMTQLKATQAEYAVLKLLEPGFLN